MNEKRIVELDQQEIKYLRSLLIAKLKSCPPDELVKLSLSKEVLRITLFDKFDDKLFFFLSLENYYLLEKLDFSNISFDDVFVANFDFSKLHNVFINPKKVWKKDLSCGDYENVTFTDSLDNCLITASNFQGSINAKVNPQTVINKDLSYGNYIGVVLTENLDGCNIKNSIFNEKEVRGSSRKIKK